MKILHLRSSGGFYGAEAVIVSLAKKQLCQGLDVCVGVITSQAIGQENTLIRRCVEEGIPVQEFVCRGKIDWNTIKEVRGYLLKNKVDILHSHGYKSDLFGLLVGGKLGVKKISTVHGYMAKSLRIWSYEFVDRLVLKWFFDEIILVSEEQRHLFKTPKVSVILNGIDVANFARSVEEGVLENRERKTENGKFISSDPSSVISFPSSVSSSPSSFIIGIVGRLSVEKGHIYLLRAFAKLLESGKRRTESRNSAGRGQSTPTGTPFSRVGGQPPDAPSSAIRPPLSLRLLVIGDGPLGAKLVELVRRTKILRGKVRFLPAQKDIKKFYNQMDVLVLPSLSEGLPMTLLEGMAMELPVVATRVGGIPGVVKDGFNGLLVEPGNVEELTRALKRIAFSVSRISDIVYREDKSEIRNTKYEILNLSEITTNAREAGRGQSTVGGQPPDAPSSVLSSPLSLAEMTTNARETVALHFSTERMASEYLNIYRNL